MDSSARRASRPGAPGRLDGHKSAKWDAARYGMHGPVWFLAVGSVKAHFKAVFFDGVSRATFRGASLATRPKRALGGRAVSLGSDAHRSEDIGADFDRAASLALAAGIRQTVVFKDGLPTFMPLQSPNEAPAPSNDR